MFLPRDGQCAAIFAAALVAASRLAAKPLRPPGRGRVLLAPAEAHNIGHTSTLRRVRPISMATSPEINIQN